MSLLHKLEEMVWIHGTMNMTNKSDIRQLFTSVPPGDHLTPGLDSHQSLNLRSLSLHAITEIFTNITETRIIFCLFSRYFLVVLDLRETTRKESCPLPMIMPKVWRGWNIWHDQNGSTNALNIPNVTEINAWIWIYWFNFASECWSSIKLCPLPLSVIEDEDT